MSMCSYCGAVPIVVARCLDVKFAKNMNRNRCTGIEAHLCGGNGLARSLFTKLPSCYGSGHVLTGALALGTALAHLRYLYLAGLLRPSSFFSFIVLV